MSDKIVITINDDDYAETGTCSICHGTYERWGNNAFPINEGRCCHDCNSSYVIPVRLRAMRAAYAGK